MKKKGRLLYINPLGEKFYEQKEEETIYYGIIRLDKKTTIVDHCLLSEVDQEDYKHTLDDEVFLTAITKNPAGSIYLINDFF